MDEKGDALERVAREAIDQYGADPVDIIRERTELALHLGDELSAEEWRDIANAAERILRS